MTDSLAWKPQPGPQTALIDCPVEDVFFGGARGGGKTSGLLGDFLFYATKHGAKAKGILFRRTYPELEEVMSQAQAIYGPGGWTYEVQAKTWKSPAGATLKLRYLDRDADADGYQGHGYTWMGFDEIGNWPSPVPIDKLWACLRSTDNVPLLRRSSGNPGGPGHAWVKKRYRVSEKRMQAFEWAPNPDYPQHTIKSAFIPSKLEDNALMKNREAYVARLAASGSTALFKAWREGDWDVTAGQFFSNWDPAKQVIRLANAGLEPWHQRWLSMDWGFKDDAAIHWHAIDENKKVTTYRELVVNEMEPLALGELIVKYTPKDEAIKAFYLGGDAFAQRNSVRTIAMEIGSVTKAAGLPTPSRADDDRIGGWNLMFQMLERGHWQITDNCSVLIESIPLLQRDEKHLEDCAASPVDHAPDSARYGLKTHIRRVAVPVAEQVERELVGKLSPDMTIAHIQRRVIEGRIKSAMPKPFRAARRRFA